MAKYKIMVNPFKHIDVYVQRGDIYDTKGEAEKEAIDWEPLYASVKVEECEGWELSRERKPNGN